MSEIAVHQTPAPMRPRDYSSSQLQLVKRTVAKDCNDDEFNMFIEICKRQGLDPFRKQIYAFVFNKSDEKKRQFVTVTGIDGYRAVAKRTGTYRPADKEPEYEFDETRKDPELNPAGLVKCTVVIYQFGPDKQWYPVVGTARWDEFAPVEAAEFEWVDTGEVWEDSGKAKKRKVPKGSGKKLAKENWKTMPHVMLAKCAEAQALRKGWPEEYGNIYVTEELDRMESDITASEVVKEFEKEQRLTAVGGVDSYPMVIERDLEMVPSGQMADRVLSTLRSLETTSEIDVWMERNRVGLQQYWAKEKSDALALKKEIEAIKATKPKFKTDIQQ